MIYMKRYIYTSSFLYSYQVPRYSRQNSFPLPMQLCLYQAEFFTFDKELMSSSR